MNKAKERQRIGSSETIENATPTSCAVIQRLLGSSCIEMTPQRNVIKPPFIPWIAKEGLSERLDNRKAAMGLGARPGYETVQALLQAPPSNLGGRASLVASAARKSPQHKFSLRKHDSKRHILMKSDSSHRSDGLQSNAD